MEQKNQLSQRQRDEILRTAARRSFARMWDPSVPQPQPEPAASLLSVSAPLRREAFRRRYPMAAC